jgi:hypothetical protein
MTSKEQHEFELDLWRREVLRCEEIALRSIGTPCGGRQAGETVDQYCRRVQAEIQLALTHLSYAEQRYGEILG